MHQSAMATSSGPSEGDVEHDRKPPLSPIPRAASVPSVPKLAQHLQREEEPPCTTCIMSSGAEGTKILIGDAKPGHIQRASSESAVEVLGPIVDRDIAVLNEQRAQKTLRGTNDAMRLLTRLVSAPIAGANNSADATSSSPPSADKEHSEEKRVLEEIDQLLDSSSFLATSTPFPALFNAVQMLRDTQRLTAQEADEAVSDSQKAQKQREDTEVQLAEAHALIAELSRKNDKLRKERKVLARCVKSYMSNVEHEKEQQLNDAYAFITHEMMLQSPRSNKTSSSVQSPGHTRYETPIDETVFLEALKKDDITTPIFRTQSQEEQSNTGPTSTNATVFHPNSPPPDRIMKQRSAEWRATVVISPGSGQESRHHRVHSSATASLASGVDDATYITAPEEEEEDEAELMPAGDFLAARMNDDLIDRNLYTISFPTNKIGLEIITITKGGELQSQQPAKKGGVYNYRICPDSFVITGYKNYYSHAKRPELGARLVAIDGERVDYGTWSMQKIGQKIRAKKGGVKLGFRNDPLPKAVIDFLNVNGKKMSSRRAGENEAPVAAIRVPKGKDIAPKIKIPLLNIDNHPPPPQSSEPPTTPARQESGAEVVWRKRSSGGGFSIPIVSPGKKE